MKGYDLRTIDDMMEFYAASVLAKERLSKSLLTIILVACSIHGWIEGMEKVTQKALCI